MSAFGRVRLEQAEVTGDRLRLRPITVEDAPSCFEQVHGVRAITDWIQWDGPERVEELEESYASWPTDTEEMTGYRFAVIDLESDEWAGSVDVRHLKEHPVATLGYLIGVPFQGRGLASEAVRFLVELAFQELSVLLVRAEVFEGNQPSIRVLEKAGLRLEDGQEVTCEKRGLRIKKQVYSVSRVEWGLRSPCEHPWTTRAVREG